MMKEVKKMNNSKVSVIIPIYNVEKYIKKCLDSLLNQSFKDIEILAISDGSPDNSANIVKEYQQKDKRIKLFEKENGGYGSVLKFAIEHANSEYAIVCDPDDWLETNCIEILYDYAKQNDLDIVMAAKYLAYNDGTLEVEKFENEFYKLEASKIYENFDVQKFSFMPPSPHAKLYKLSTLKGINFPYHVSYTDLILYLISLKKAKKVLYIDKPLAYYLLDRPGNTRTDKKPKAIKDHLVVWNSIYTQIQEEDRILIYRLYKEIKYITKVYYRNSTELFNDANFNYMIESIKLLKKYYYDIKKNFTKNLFEKFELYMILHSKKTLRFYITFRKKMNK